jgi:chorismate mutase
LKNISEIRNEIDIIDHQVFGLLKKRLKLVLETLDAKDSVEDLSREDEIFRTISSISENEYEDRYIGNIYLAVFTEGKKIKEIIKKSRT